MRTVHTCAFGVCPLLLLVKKCACCVDLPVYTSKYTQEDTDAQVERGGSLIVSQRERRKRHVSSYILKQLEST